MYNISEQQIEYILNDIRRNGVEMEDLQLNLLDHICCIIEQNLKEGDDFEDFYRKTVKQFCKHELWEIEEETIILLTIKNYYVMKKSMIISGVISVAALIGGSLFKIMHWQGASFFLIIGIGILSFIFLPLVFFLKTKEEGNKRDKLITAIGILIGILLCTSTVFAIMHFNSAKFLWLTTVGISMFIFIPIYFVTGIRKPETKVNTIVTSIILIGATGLLFTLINLKTNPTVTYSNLIVNKNLIATINYINTNNKLQYKNYSKDSLSLVKNLKNKSDNLCFKIEKLKLEIFNNVEDKHDTIINYNDLSVSNSINYEVPTHMLFEDNTEPNLKLINFKNELIEYTDFIEKNYAKKSFGSINAIDKISIINNGYFESWERINFYRVPASILLRNLTQMQLDIRVVEASCL